MKTPAKPDANHHKLFIPGQRIVRTVIAILLCMLVYEARGRRGMPIFALIAAVMCITPYTQDTKAIARRRVIGTLIGAGLGVITLLLESRLLGMEEPDGIIHYIIAALGAGIVIYFTVWLHLTDIAQFAGIVFLIVVITQTGSSNVFQYAYHRIIDTLIGIAVGECVNRVHLPRLRNTDTLFATGITNTLFEEGDKLSGYSLIELNRLIDDGCKFTVDTVEAPASVRELLRDVHIRLPIIAMDGAILYDLKERKALHTVLMDCNATAAICKLLEEREVEFFMSTVDQQILIIRHGELKNDAIRDVYERKRYSPYRNYVPRDNEDAYLNNTIYFYILDRTEKVDNLMSALIGAPWASSVRIKADDRHIPEGYRCIRIFPAAATKEHMLARLREMTGARNIVTFGSEKGQCDVFVENADKDIMVKELKRRFEPVSVKGWRNIFSLR